MDKMFSALMLAVLFACSAQSQTLYEPLYEFPGNRSSRVSSFENLNGKKGSGAMTNKTAKGHAFEVIKPGETKTLLDINNSGIIQRIWLTVDQNPLMLRSLRLQLFWEGGSKPAVDVPLGDFFGSNLGRPVAFQSALFSTAEGRSFNCYIPMPFRKGARIQIINESEKEAAKLFFDVDYLLTNDLPSTILYFHCCWNRQKSLKPGEDVLILPMVRGRGRFLGMSAAVLVDSTYENTWWGEGEVKIFLDGDSASPTIAGTGTEDYLGSGWGLGSFSNQYQGCTVADGPGHAYDFYRLHLPDAIYFDRNIKVSLQQIGGGFISEVRALMKKGVAIKPVSVDAGLSFYRLLEGKDSTQANFSLDHFSEGWVNFYRVDDYAVTAYYYLDRPEDEMPPLAGIPIRVSRLNH
jgi:hypothetical protein